MSFVLVLAGLGLLAFAWRAGWLKRWTMDDGIAAVAFLLGLRLATTGRIAMGAAVMMGAAAYGYWRRRPSVMAPEEARQLLGVSAEASPDQIRDAHRRLIARVHPDAGGSTDLAARVNRARDALLAEHRQLRRRGP